MVLFKYTYPDIYSDAKSCKLITWAEIYILYEARVLFSLFTYVGNYLWIFLTTYKLIRDELKPIFSRHFRPSIVLYVKLD